MEVRLLAVIWAIWKERNMRCFDWFGAACFAPMAFLLPPLSSPFVGCFKLNFDGSVLVNPGPSGIGGLVLIRE